jgi:lipid-binding SYLF domain-containing protein
MCSPKFRNALLSGIVLVSLGGCATPAGKTGSQEEGGQPVTAGAGSEAIGETGKYQTAISVFRNAGASSAFFDHSYGYAVFPSIGEASFGIGGAHGKGRVYVRNEYVGDVAVSQVSLGYQIGVQSYRQVIFFEDERAFREFASGNFEFGAETGLVWIHGGATAAAGSSGATAALGDTREAFTAGGYHKGMAVFAATRGGVVLKLSLSGQKYTYRPLPQASP